LRVKKELFSDFLRRAKCRFRFPPVAVPWLSFDCDSMPWASKKG